MRLEQIVEPGRPGAFFEGHRQSSTQSRQELQNGGGFGFQHGLHDYLASAIHHRDRDGCLMHVEPNILFTVHEGAPFRRWWCLRSQPTPKGAPFYNAISSSELVSAHGAHLFVCSISGPSL